MKTFYVSDRKDLEYADLVQAETAEDAVRAWLGTVDDGEDMAFTMYVAEEGVPNVWDAFKVRVTYSVDVSITRR